jgi:hypothetical protein
MTDTDAGESLAIDFDPPPLTGAADVFGRAAWLWAHDLRNFGRAVVVLWLPIEVIKEWLFYRTGQQDNVALQMRIEGPLETVVGSIVAPAVIYAIVTRMRSGRVAGLGEMLAWGWRRSAQTFRSRALASLATVLGLVLLVVPGLVFAVRFSLVVPIIAVEGERQRRVLSRSHELVRGRAWLVFRAALLAGLAIALLMFAIVVLLGIWDTWWMSAITGFIVDVEMTFLTVVFLLVYLGIVGRTPDVIAPVPAPPPPVE